MKFKSQNAIRSAMAVVIPLALAAGSAGAQYGQSGQSGTYGRDQRDQQNGRMEVLEWQGGVDREIRIQVDNRQASVIEMGSNERARRRVNMMSGIPNRPGELYVEKLEGRGKVDVVQQPNARNGYTAVIRLRDPDGGAARYRIAVYWQGTGRYDRYDNRRRH